MKQEQEQEWSTLHFMVAEGNHIFFFLNKKGYHSFVPQIFIGLMKTKTEEKKRKKEKNNKCFSAIRICVDPFSLISVDLISTSSFFAANFYLFGFFFSHQYHYHCCRALYSIVAKQKHKIFKRLNDIYKCLFQGFHSLRAKPNRNDAK